MADLKKKLKARTTTVNGVKKTFEVVIPKIVTDYTDNDYLDLIAQKELVVKKMGKIESLSNEIFELTLEADGKLDEEEREASELEVYMTRKLKELELVIKKKEIEANPREEKPKDETAGGARKTFSLPKLHIKNFNGDRTLWRTFFDSFSCAIDSNKSLSAVEKMNYLINLLTDEAAETIKGLTLCDTNYAVAITLLKIDMATNKQ